MRRLESLFAVVVALAIFLPGLGRTQLIDPWETHYGEVGRRMLEDHDWVRLSWADEGFRSKPALAPWAIAAGLRAHRLAADGGRPGELAASTWTSWAARLPFALCAALGLLALFAALRRLASRSVAWLALFVVGTSPLYLLLGRQAITDMPMVAATTGAVALFALALHDGDRPPARVGPLPATRAVQLLVAAVVIVQVAYGAIHLGSHPSPGAGAYDPRLVVLGPTLLTLAALGVLWWRFPLTQQRHAYLVGAYALLAVSVLAKGPPGVALVGVTGAAYVGATRQWRALARLRLVDGLLVVVLIAGPWHAAMAVEDGAGWVTEYIGHHWLSRAAGGAHSANAPDAETFRYYVEQLGYGLLPWFCLVPAAVAHATRASLHTTAGRVRWLALLWAGLGVILFTCVRTRFHHYVAPALGGFGVLLAFLLDDAARGRLASRERGLMVLGAALMVPIALDLSADQATFLELVTYRYDRPWPASQDLRAPIVGLCAAAAASTALLALSRRALIASLLVAAATWFFLVGPYMEAAAPHWGQRDLARTYYRERAPTDPLVAWQLYWRGEVFWTHGLVTELRHGDAAQLRRAIAAHPSAERIFVVTEAGRRAGLRAAVPAELRGSFEVEDKSSNKFVLVSFGARAPP